MLYVRESPSVGRPPPLRVLLLGAQGPEQSTIKVGRPQADWFFFSSRRRHTRYWRDWSSDVCSSDLHSQNGINVTGVNLTAAQLNTLGLRYPNILTAVPSVGSANPNLYYFAPDYVQPYVEQGRLGVERELAKGLSLSATYLFYKGVHLTRTRDVNLSAPVALNATGPGGTVYTFERFPTARPISRTTGTSYNRISVFESASRSLYNGLAFQATQRFTRGLQFIAAYTYSKAKDDRPDQTTVVVGADDAKIVQNQLNPAADYARSDTDLRHRFVFSPVYDIGKIKWSENPR